MASDGPSRKHKPAVELLFATLPAEMKFAASEKRELANFANTLAAKVAGGRGFTCLIADDRELLRLNHAFLGKKFPTDVLSFPTSGPDLGELAISIERAQAQALAYGHARLDEIRILMLHGVLHLTGLDHENDAGEMARAERRWRAEFALPPTLIARVRQTATRKALAI